MKANDIWKLVLAALLLLVFVYVGISNVIKPDIRRLRKGGEMLTEWNRVGVRSAGAIFAAGAIYLLYRLLRDIFAK
jgi:hypothetical protein